MSSEPPARPTRSSKLFLCGGGTGGYVCVPLFLAAWAARVPTAIYLPDVIPGLAVRFLARLATVVACNVEDSTDYLRSQILDFRLGESQLKIKNQKSKIV